MNFDAAIIGASSAGLFAAEGLARAGWRVGVFEQERGLSRARRTLIVTFQLKRLLDCELDGAVLQHTRVMAVNTTGACTRIELREPDMVIERSSLGEFLARRAQEAGVNLYPGYRFRGLEPHPEGGHPAAQQRSWQGGQCVRSFRHWRRRLLQRCSLSRRAESPACGPHRTGRSRLALG
jgi:flavin-dependent dehydrogenase